jgi:hypothetical protein
MKVTTNPATKQVTYQGENPEERKSLLKMLRPKGTRFSSLRPMGSQMSNRRMYRHVSSTGAQLKAPTTNNRAKTACRQELMQSVEVQKKVIVRVYPDGRRDTALRAFLPARFKSITHSHQGWIR